MGRRILYLVVALITALVPTAVAISPAAADSASTMLSLVNGLRASHGLRPLAADAALTAAAQQWAAHMAAAGALGHNANLGSQIPAGWTKLGENVGAGGSIPIIFNALVASPFHLGNMLDTSYSLTGIGVVVGARGTLWLAEDFEATTRAPATTAPPATAPPTTVRPTPRPTTVAPTVAPTAPTIAGAAPTTVPALVPDATAGVPDLTSVPTDVPPIKRTATLATSTGGSGHGISPWVLGACLFAVLSLAGTTAVVGRRILRPPGH